MASFEDVEWGNENNPEVFVKIWYDISGRIDVNFFHVSVPDIKVWSAISQQETFESNDEPFSDLTLDARYARHVYEK